MVNAVQTVATSAQCIATCFTVFDPQTLRIKKPRSTTRPKHGAAVSVAARGVQRRREASVVPQFFDIPLATQDPHLPLELTRLARTLHSLHRFTEPATPESVTTIPYSLFPARALPASRFRAPRAVGSQANATTVLRCLCGIRI